MDSADLRVFEAVARLGGMNRAAAELNTVQSAVTARIRQLEDALGVKLFLRHNRGVALTAAGQRLLPYATQVRHLLEDARQAVADSGQPTGRLVIGALETTAGARLPPILAAFTGACPLVDLVLRTGTTGTLIEDVLERRVEGAFVCGPVDHPDLTAKPMFGEELVVITDRSVRSLDALAGVPGLRKVMFRAGCSYRQRLERLLVRRGATVAGEVEFGTVDGILGCVAAGLGVTLLPKVVAEPAWRDGRVMLHALPPSEARVETVFIRRRDAYLTSALAGFLACVRAQPAAVDAAE